VPPPPGRNRPGYPRFSHYDTWTVDQLQNVYEAVFGIPLYPGWLNGSSYERTPEETGLAPITSVELRAAINKLALPNLKLRIRDLRYLAERTGVKVPALPWRKDQKLLSRLVLEIQRNMDQTRQLILASHLQHVLTGIRRVS
jgi:hypothetical protein